MAFTDRLAVPAVYALVLFLSYSSQWLFLYLEPEPLSRTQTIRFNVLLICLLVSYTRTVLVDPGHIPSQHEEEMKKQDAKKQGPRKWCRKCDAAKPPRAHHCRQCRRCIPKMDHHCPWTNNCVSHTTFPHFMRFLFYAVVSMSYLSYFLWIRGYRLWETRNMPSSLGPSIWQLAHFFLLCLFNSFTLFAMTLLFGRDIWCLALNQTTIEGWEIERHKTLVRRARYFGGYLEGPDGLQIRIQKQEFPFDIGIWKNIIQGMGTGNVLAWLWPFSATPSVSTGVSFETNGFEDLNLQWPPPDPDRLFRKVPKGMDKADEAFTYRDAALSQVETVAAFKKRQEEDAIRRRKPFGQRVEAKISRQANNGYDVEESDFDVKENVEYSERKTQSGEEGWKNSEGERLRDFGLDEEIEFYDEEDELPLSELIARKKARASQ